MNAKQPIRIDKSFNFSEVEVNEEGATIPFIKIKGYASKMFDEQGKFVIDADSENIDTMGIDISRLKSGNLPLLYGHDQSKPVGKITSAEYKADGLEIEATLYKLPNDPMTNFVYESVKVGNLNSFSVGIIVKEFEIIERDGEDYLQLAASELIETSLVAVPSNPKATFGILEVKSADSGNTSYKTVISRSALKAENPNACSEFEQCAIETKDVQTEDKGLTYDETKTESWVKSQDFSKYMGILFATIEDNWYEEKWGDVSPEEALLNVKGTMDSFIADFEKLIIDDNTTSKGNDLNLKGKEMATKDVAVTEDPPVEGIEKVEEATPAKEAKDEKVPEESKVVVVEEVDKVEAKEEKQETPAEVSAPVRTLNDLLADASELKPNIESMDLEQLENVYEVFSGVTELIENLVTEQVKAELEEATPAA